MSAVYNWTTTSQSGQSPFINIPVNLGVLTFSDQAVAAGHVSLTENCISGPCVITGDPSQVSLVVDIMFNPGPNTAHPFPGNFFADITSFDVNGTIDGELRYSDGSEGFAIANTSGVWSGQFNSDGYNCSTLGSPTGGIGCNVTGQWLTAVSEPMSAVILATALVIAMAFRCGRRRY